MLDRCVEYRHGKHNQESPGKNLTELQDGILVAAGWKTARGVMRIIELIL